MPLSAEVMLVSSSSGGTRKLQYSLFSELLFKFNRLNFYLPTRNLFFFFMFSPILKYLLKLSHNFKLILMSVLLCIEMLQLGVGYY